jgi:hypothetical protein
VEGTDAGYVERFEDGSAESPTVAAALVGGQGSVQEESGDSMLYAAGLAFWGENEWG